MAKGPKEKQHLIAARRFHSYWLWGAPFDLGQNTTNNSTSKSWGAAFALHCLHCNRFCGLPACDLIDMIIIYFSRPHELGLHRMKSSGI